MTLKQPLFMQNDTTDQAADIVRLLLRDLCNERPGIVQENAFQVVQRGAGANNSVDVGAGGCIVPGTQNSQQGYYYFVNDATVNVPMSAAANATNPRIDTVFIRAQDQVYSGALNEGNLLYQAGTAAASPVAPDLTALGFNNYWRLANISVPANDNTIVTGDITDLRTSPTITPAQGRASAVGGVIVCTSTSRPSGPRLGQLIWETDTKLLLVWDGSWRNVGGTGTWTSFTPTYQGFTSQPGTRYGRWTRQGNTVVAEGGFVASAASNATITATLPVSCVDPGTGVRFLGGGRGFDTSASANYASIGIIAPSTDPTRIINFGTAAGGPWGTATPFPWASGDTFDWFTAYEVA